MKDKDIRAILITVAGMAVYELLVKDILKNVLKGVTGNAGNSGNQAVTR